MNPIPKWFEDAVSRTSAHEHLAIPFRFSFAGAALVFVTQGLIEVFLGTGGSIASRFAIDLGWSFFFILSGVGFLSLGAIVELPDRVAPTPLPIPKVSETRVRLMWQHQFQFSGIYAALATTAFAVHEGGSPTGLDPLATVAEGVDDLGVTSASALIRWHHSRETRLVPLALIFENSPACLIFDGDRPAVADREFSLAHVYGRRVSVVDYDDPAVIEFRALMQARSMMAQFRPSLNVRTDLRDPLRFLNGNAEGRLERCEYRVGYTFNEGLIAEASTHGKYRVVRLYDAFKLDTPLYADVLFAREDRITGSDGDRLMKIADAIVTGYSDLVKAEIHTGSIKRVHDLLTKHCPEWYQQLQQQYGNGYSGKNLDAKLLGKLRESCGDMGLRVNYPLGALSGWRGLEQLVTPGVLEEVSFSRFLESVDPIRKRVAAK